MSDLQVFRKGWSVMRRKISVFLVSFSMVTFGMAIGVGSPAAYAAPGDNIIDINPDASDNGNRNSTAGGRVNGSGQRQQQQLRLLRRERVGRCVQDDRRRRVVDPP